MIRILIPLALLIITAILVKRYLEHSPPGTKKARQLNLVIATVTIGLIILTLVHRMHWIAPLLSSIALITRLAIQAQSKPITSEKTIPDADNSNQVPISEEESLKILGLTKPYTEQDVVDSHRKLIQKFHPDRGGNDYLASQINHAKDKLLNLLKNTR